MAQAPLQVGIVDDFPEDREAIRRALRKGLARHFVCHEATNGEETLRLFSPAGLDGAPTLDILLLDLNLPGMNGIEILHQLKGDLAILPLPVVILTGTMRESEALAALAAGAQDFIAKSQITPENITRVVLNAIERFRLIRELHTREALFRGTFEQAAVGMAHIGLDGRWLRLNQRFCDIVGYTNRELLSTTFHAISYPDDVVSDIEAARQILAGEIQSASLPKRYLHKSGRLVWVKRTLSLVRNAQCLPDYFVSVIEDITALKQAEQALIESEERYHRVVEDQTELICRYGADLRLTFVNQAYATAVGKSPAALIGQNMLDSVPVAYRDKFRAHLAALTVNNPVAIAEAPTQLSDGTLRWFQWTDRLILDRAGMPSEYQGVGHDITERKQAEAAELEQRQLAEALRDSLAALTGSLDVNKIMAQILASVATVVPSEGGSIILFDGNMGRVAFLRGFPPDAEAFFRDYRFPLSALRAASIVAKTGAYAIADTQAQADWIQLPPCAWIRSSISIPIELHGVMIGLLVLDSTTPNHFQPADVEKLQAFAHYAGLALENAEHVTQLEANVAARTAELRNAKEAVEALLNNSLDGIVLVDPDLCIQQANRAFEQFFGGTAQQGYGRSLLEVIHIDDRARVAALLQSVLIEQIGTEVALRAVNQSGTSFAAEFSISPLNTEGLVCTVRDITERIRTAESLREQRDFLQLIIDSVPSLITVKDYDGLFYLINRRLADLYGITPTDILGKRDSVIPNTRVPVVVQRTQDQMVIDSGQPLFVAEEKVLERYYQKTKIPLQNADGNYDRVLMIATDITDRKIAEEALQQALQKEKELGELKSRFISMASHEFRTPLTVIRTTADTLLAYRHKLPSDQIDKRLGKIQEQVLYLRDIIEDVLQLTRLQAGRAEFNPVKLDLDLLCRNVIDELRSQLEGAHRLNYQYEGNLQELYLDKKMMRQIINNLLSNAIKYSPGDKPVWATLAHRNDALVFEVSDEGIGIPAADLNHIFEPFHRAANVGNISGTGLGLVIAKESVELQGGILMVTSQEGKGTTFTVNIPLPGTTELGKREAEYEQNPSN